ncbi:MAG: patatin-like phospholipase family protein [Elusimicrobia bacterium]|nr:patatin-like phospholipase family protein [Elusimicrobiota bacterium]
MTPEEIESFKPFLGRIPLFKDLTLDDLSKVAATMKPLSLPRGATLFSQGDPPDSFYVITSGHVQVRAERGGRTHVLGYRARGDTVGETALLSGEPRAFTAVLDTTCEFLVLSKADFSAALAESPALLLQLSRSLSLRLSTETRLGRGKRPQPRLMALVGALPDDDRAAFAAALGHALAEQTRRRVILVDLDPRTGAAARSLGLPGRPVGEEDLHGRDLRDPRVLSDILETHPSGLGVLSITPQALSGRLYRSLFLLFNLLRDHSDYVLLSLRGGREDVERAALSEADLWVLAGSQAGKPEFLSRQAELAAFTPSPARVLEVWLGASAPDELVYSKGREWVLVPWPEGLGAECRARGVFDALRSQARARAGVEGLARRFARLRVGVALGTGAALGYALIGIIKAFERAGIPIDCLAGTSIGSVVGGLHALGLTGSDIEKIAVGVDRAWVWENLFWDLTVPRSGVFAGTTLHRFLKSYFGEREFHELEIPFACVAADIETGEEVVFREGRVADAVRASCGIPLVFQPFPHQGRFLVDGGLVDPVPIRTVSRMGADLLVAVNLTMPAGSRKTRLRDRRLGEAVLELDLERLKELTLPKALQAPNMAQIFFQMIYTMEYEIAKSRSQLAHVEIHPDLTGFSWTELHRAKEIIEAGEKVAEAVLPKVSALLPFFADRGSTGLRQRPW